MKKIISVILVIGILLSMSACAEKPHDHDHDHEHEHKYNTVAFGNHSVYVDGKFMEGYANNTVKLQDLAAALGIEAQVSATQTKTAPYTLSVKLNNTAFDFATGKDGVEYDGTDWYVPETVAQTLGFNRYETDSTVYYTEYPLADGIVKGKKVPTLMYHAVSDNMWGIESLFVSPSELEKQLQYIRDNGYTTITFEDLDNLETIEKPVMLTFDDGYEDNYLEMFPLLKKYNMKATVFVITGEIGKDKYMKQEQIGEMSASGLVSIQSHTVTHPFLSDCDEAKLDTELKESKNTLASITGKEPFVLCYPTGKYSDLSLQKTAQYYQFGVLMNGGMYNTNDNTTKIKRFYVSRSTTVSEFADMID